MADIPITMLSGLTTNELTLTNRGANNRRFALTKGYTPMDSEILEALIGTPAEGEDKFLATLKSAGLDNQEKIDAAVAQFRLQKGMKDLIDADTMASVSEAAGYAVQKAEHEEGAEEDTEDTPLNKKKVKPGMKKSTEQVDLSELTGAARSQVESVFKSHASMVERTAQLENVVKSLQNAQKEKQYVAKAAKEFSHLPLGNQELGVMLKSAHDVNPAFAKGFETLLGRMDELVEKSSLMTTMGAVNKANTGGGWSKIEALAEGIVRKSTESAIPMTKAQAVDAVMKTDQGKELYREYLGDNPRQRAEIY